MKKTIGLLCALALIIGIGMGSGCQTQTAGDYPVQPVPFTQVQLGDQFWLPRMETNRKVTIPYAFEQCEETGRVKNFELAAGVGEGSFCTVYPFDDSDVYKIIEGAAYSLQIYPDHELDKYVDAMIVKIAAAQEEDGYLYTARTIESDEPVRWTEGDRWSNLYMGHELYNMGHLYEAAVAHYLATGKRSLLDIALKNADLIDSVFGPGKKRGAPGHQVIEMGLVKLYRVSGERRYLDLAKFFLDERGDTEHRKTYGRYSQDHKPVIEQSEAVGHAVRATYMYAGMADVAALTGDAAYIAAIDRIWNDVVTGKLYLTGGIGATSSGEAFGGPYNLPNASAYAETCAAIGNAFWNHHQFLLHGDAKYIDVLERVIYNGLISGVALTGNLFFYPNPLASHGQHERSPWFNCACCPSNISRFMPSIPGYVYGQKDKDLYINLFVQSEVQVDLGGQKVVLKQSTKYPWEGKIHIDVEPEKTDSFNLFVRIPGWARNEPIPSDLYRFLQLSEEKPSIKINGEDIPLELENGYVPLRRRWDAGDTIELELPMPVRRVLSHDNVKDNQGRIALQRGPLVYCAEWPDNAGGVSHLVLPDENELTVEMQANLFDGVAVIKGQATALYGQGEDKPYQSKQQTFTAIPYYAWAHRGKGEMAVWLAREDSGARPLPQPTLASQSQVTASEGKQGEPIQDLWEPESSRDRSQSYLHWWPRKGTLEWVQYDFPKAVTISEAAVYWYDDTGRGECRVPASWKLLYKRGDRWIPVSGVSEYGVEKDTFNRVTFTPVRTTGLRLELQSQDKFSAGIHELKVK
jgi:DUF1680 family protein